MSDKSPILTLCDVTGLNHERYEWLLVLFGQIKQEAVLADSFTQNDRLNTIDTLSDIATLLIQQFQDELLEQQINASKIYDRMHEAGQ